MGWEVVTAMGGWMTRLHEFEEVGGSPGANNGNGSVPVVAVRGAWRFMSLACVGTPILPLLVVEVGW